MPIELRFVKLPQFFEAGQGDGRHSEQERETSRLLSPEAEREGCGQCGAGTRHPRDQCADLGDADNHRISKRYVIDRTPMARVELGELPPDAVAEGEDVLVHGLALELRDELIVRDVDRVHDRVGADEHRELAAMAYAAKRTLVTVERIVDRNLLQTEDSAAGVLPSLYVEAVAVAERGAWPLALWDEYDGDGAEVARYAAMARTEEGFRAYLSTFLTCRKQIA